jgi:hypothetical protein
MRSRPRACHSTRRHAELEAGLRKQFPHVENWNSRSQLVALLQSHGWEPDKFTKKAKQASLDDEALETLPSQFPNGEFDGLAEYFVLGRRLGQLANGKEAWLKHIAADGRIHGDIVHIGTPHSRAAHREPAFIPSADSVRRSFRA